MAHVKRAHTAAVFLYFTFTTHVALRQRREDPQANIIGCLLSMECLLTYNFNDFFHVLMSSSPLDSRPWWPHHVRQRFFRGPDCCLKNEIQSVRVEKDGALPQQNERKAKKEKARAKRYTAEGVCGMGQTWPKKRSTTANQPFNIMYCLFYQRIDNDEELIYLPALQYRDGYNRCCFYHLLLNPGLVFLSVPDESPI